MGKLKNFKVGFGTASSPTILTKQRLLAVVRSIEDDTLTTQYSGYVKLESDSINAAQKYVLATAGISHIGAVTSVDFSVSASKSSMRELESATLSAVSSESISQSAFRYQVKSVSVTSGSITNTALKNLCSIVGNTLTIGNSNLNERWTGSVTIEAWIDTDPNNKKELTISLTGIVVATDFSYSSVPENIYVENDGTTQQSFTLSYSPSGCDTPSQTPVITSDDERITVSDVTVNGFKLNVTADESYNALITINQIGVTKSFTVHVYHKVVPTIGIDADDSYEFFAESNTKNFGFTYNPNTYNVEVSLVSVTCVANHTTINTGYSKSGFGITTSGLTEDDSVAVTATFLVDGKTVYVTKIILMKRLFYRFSIYKNSAWLTNQSGSVIRVGNVQATYLMDGVWEVNNDSVQAQDDKKLYVDGAEFGEYGKERYTDGSELVQSNLYCLKDVLVSNNGGEIYQVDYDRFYPMLSEYNDLSRGVYYTAKQDILFSKLSSKNTSLVGYPQSGGYDGGGTNMSVYDENRNIIYNNSVNIPTSPTSTYLLKKGYIIQFIKTGSQLRGGVMTDIVSGYSYKESFSPTPEDLTLTIPSSFNAINGDGEMTCNLVNTGNTTATITSIQSSNAAFIITNNGTSFKCAVRNTIEDISTTLAITIQHGDKTETITKEVSALWEEQEVPPPSYDQETLDTLGVAIMDVDGNLYASLSEWNSTGKGDVDLMGLAFSDGVVRFLIPSTLKECTFRTYEAYNYTYTCVKDYSNAVGVSFLRANDSHQLKDDDITRRGNTDYIEMSDYIRHTYKTDRAPANSLTHDGMHTLCVFLATVKSRNGGKCYLGNTYMANIVCKKLQSGFNVSNKEFLSVIVSDYYLNLNIFFAGVDPWYYYNEQSGTLGGFSETYSTYSGTAFAVVHASSSSNYNAPFIVYKL